MIETSQLQTLVAVTNAGSFSRAAQDLKVTQSAISQSIKNLETKVGLQIFKRTGKKVSLTTEGEKLFLLARDFLEKIEETLADISNDKNSMRGKVRIGTLTGVGKSWLGHEMLQFLEDEKDISLSITLGFQEDLITAFENNQLDILILPEKDLPSVGEKKLLSQEKATLVFSEKFSNVVTKNITIEELVKLPIILFEPGDPLFYNWCRERFGHVPRKLNIKFVMNSHGPMLEAVQNGLGVAVVPTHVLMRSYFRDKVKTLGHEFEIVNGNFFLVYHKESWPLMRIQKTVERLLASDNPLAKSY